MPVPGWSWRFTQRNPVTRVHINATYWSLLLTIGALATVTQVNWSWRFSLRTLLIATTLVAVVVGLSVAFP